MARPDLAGIRAEKARRRLSDFVRYAWQALEPGTPLDWGWHHNAICDHVQWAMEEWAAKRANPAHNMQVQNLLVNVPPRTLKSKIISVCAPAWAWLRWPEATFLCPSANPRVAADNARDSRDLISSHWYQSWFKPRWILKDDRDAVSDYGIEVPDGRGSTIKLGYRKSRGWKSKVTGEGADIQLPDDPDDAEEVHSQVVREGVHARWKNALWNRVRDLRASIRIGIQQRVHEMDWSGFVLSQAASDPEQPQWLHLVLPLHYDPARGCSTPMPVDAHNRYDPTGTRTWRDMRTTAGEVLDPVRFTDSVIRTERKQKGSYGFAAQYEQNPEPADGGMFKRSWWGFWRHPGMPAASRPDGCTDRPALDLPRLDTVVISVDASGKKTMRGSETSIQAIGAARNQRFVLDDRSGHHSLVEAGLIILEMWRTWNANKVIIEDKALGPALVEMLQLAGVTGVVPVSPDVGKEARAALAQPPVEAGDVYLPEHALWLGEFIGQFAVFPRGERNDRVDAFSQAMIELRADPSMSLFLQAWR
jgi:predicted phage terminase large subunit-like protein